MTTKEWDRQTTYKASRSPTTTQAWEVCVLYSYQGVWPSRSMTDKCPSQHGHQRVGSTTPLIKLLVVQQLLKLGRLVYYTTIKEYGQQVSKPTWPPKNRADNTTYQAPRSSTTTQAWEACVLYGQQGVWPTGTHASNCPNPQEPRPTSTQADK